MARSAKPRNSRSTRKPVTIDLDADTVVAESKSDTEDEAANAAPGASEEKLEAPIEEGSSDNHSDGADPSVQKSNARLSNLSGGLVGGLLALVGGAVLQWVGVLPNFAPEPAAVEQVDLTPLQTEIENLRNEFTGFQSSGDDGVSAEAQTAINTAIEAAQSSIAQASNFEGMIQALDAKVQEIESRISVGAAGENAGLEALASRIADLEEQSANADVAEETIAGLRSGLSSVESGLSALESDLSEQMAGLSAQIASAEEKLAGGSSSVNVATAIASAGLKSAIDRGGSFMAELEAYASVAGNEEIVSELRNYAASGVATVNQLTDQFPSVHNRIIAVGDGLASDAGVADRLMASARSLVQVRTVGDVEGEGADQIAARIEARLKESDLAAALVEWESLPDAAKEASAGFADKLRARQSVDAMVAKALSGAMAASAPNSN